MSTMRIVLVTTNSKVAAQWVQKEGKEKNGSQKDRGGKPNRWGESRIGNVRFILA